MRRRQGKYGTPAGRPRTRFPRFPARGVSSAVDRFEIRIRCRASAGTSRARGCIEYVWGPNGLAGDSVERSDPVVEITSSTPPGAAPAVTRESSVHAPDAGDLELIDAAKRHEPRAFEALMRRYNRRLFRVARSILGDSAGAEDAVQEAYISAFAHLDRYQPLGSFGAWLTRITINEALMLRRRTRRALVSLDDLDDDLTDNERRSLADWLATPDSSNAASARQLLEQAIDALPPAFRIVFVLREIEQLTVAETAACLDINRSTVKTRLHRAQARLRTDISRRLERERLTLFDFGGGSCDRIVAAVLARLGSRT
jgi:RNA polymerase sigma-70 factor, ECF subfamily